jgi:signal peptidase I
MEVIASLPESPVAVAPEPPPIRRARPQTALVDIIESLLFTVLLVLFGTTFILQAFKIPSQSMEPTLLVGDHLLVNKFVFEGTGSWYEKLLPYRPVRRGDIVVFRFPYDDHLHYVKRVIGLPGDRIRIVDKRVYVNGSLLVEPYVVHDPAADDPFGDNFPPVDGYALRRELRPEWADQILNHVQHGELVVPPDHYFVMGDNRDRSSDSRYWGFVDRRAIMGRPILIYWSVSATADDYNDRSLMASVRGIEDTLVHISSRTRWDRMLRVVR